MKISEKLLFELQPKEFEKLCLRLLETVGFEMITQMKSTIDVGFDFQGRLRGKEKTKEAVFIIKHKLELSKSDIKKILDSFFRIGTFNDIFVLVTSSKITNSHHEVVDNYAGKMGEIRIIGQDEILSLINKNSGIADEFFSPIKKQIVRKRAELSLSLIGAFLGIIGVVFSFTQQFIKEKEPLDIRIKKVESAINNIKDLESYLKEIKIEMIETEKSTQLINEKYEKAQELKSLTENQLEAINLALKTQSRMEIAFNLLMGFIIGIGSSFIASILYGKWKHYKSLK